MAMASTVLFSSPPILLLPDAVAILQGITDAEFAHLKSAGTAFQPRAPPDLLIPRADERLNDRTHFAAIGRTSPIAPSHADGRFPPRRTA